MPQHWAVDFVPFSVKAQLFFSFIVVLLLEEKMWLPDYYFFFEDLFYLIERQSYRVAGGAGREKVRLSICWLTPRRRVIWAEQGRSQKLYLDFQHGWQGLTTWAVFCFPSYVSRIGSENWHPQGMSHNLLPHTASPKTGFIGLRKEGTFSMG